MTLVSPTQVQPNDEITDSSVNTPVNQLAGVINGNLDDTNISGFSGSKIAAGTTPADALDENANVETRMSESLGDFTASGGVWSTISGLNGTMTAAVNYIGGTRIETAAVASKTFTASRDTYVYIDSTGTVQYDPQTNGAAKPTTPAGNNLLAKVVTDGSTITSVVDLRTRPPASGGFYLVNQSFSSSGTGSVSITGVPFRPKGIMVFLRPQATANVAPWQFSATDGTTFANTGITSGTTSVSNGSTTDSRLIYTINSAGTAQLVATLTSINDDGITLNITTNTGVATYTTFTFIFYG